MIVETDAGLFYTKLRGSGQAPASLVAEVVVGALADALHLPVPARVLIDIPPDIEVDDPHQELAQLLEFSVGRNLGFHVLPDARDYRLVDLPTVEAPLASAIVWLDGLVQNPDRTVKNPNLLWSGGRLWLVDHGAALGFQHNWRAVTESSPRTAPWRLDHHVLRSRATELPTMDDGWAEQLPRATLEAAIAAVPDDFFVENGVEPLRRRRGLHGVSVEAAEAPEAVRLERGSQCGGDMNGMERFAGAAKARARGMMPPARRRPIGSSRPRAAPTMGSRSRSRTPSTMGRWCVPASG